MDGRLSRNAFALGPALPTLVLHNSEWNGEIGIYWNLAAVDISGCCSIGNACWFVSICSKGFPYGKCILSCGLLSLKQSSRP